MADLWMHDHNDNYGVHFGFASSDWKNTSNGTTLTDDHSTAKIPAEKFDAFIYKDYISPYIYPLQNDNSIGERFDEAKTRYESSPFMTQQDGDFQHPIIAVFMGKKYIWPTRSTKDADGKILYLFQDYSNNDRGTMNASKRTLNIPKEGGDFMIYLDTHNTEKLYKCNYYFKTSSKENGKKQWIHVENGTPYKEAQNIINNKDTTTITREGNIFEGQVWWDYSINETNNTLIGVQFKENAEVDSTLHVTVEKNFNVYPRTGYVTLYNQYDQYKGMLVGPINGNGSDSIIYTINQPADNINFTKIEFYTNDNTSAKVKTDCYGPMISCGGDGWIYFKITGNSTLGAKRVFGEWPCQEQDKINRIAEKGIAIIGTPTYNPGTGIWTAKVTFPANVTGGSSSNNYTGNVTIAASEQTASYTEGSTIQLTAGGISSSNISATNSLTETFYISIKPSNLTDNPKYTGSVEGRICYTQNGSSTIEAKNPTYKYEITDSNIDWVQVSQTGLVTFKANNTGSQRYVTIKVSCNEIDKYATITLSQNATVPNFSGNGAYIKFYTTNEGITETTIYGPVEGNIKTTGKIYFKVFGKNENGTYFELKDKNKITNISSSTCKPQISTLEYNNIVFSCDVDIPTNNGENNRIEGEIKLSCMDAEYTAGSKAAVTWGGLYIVDSTNSKPLEKNHQITVTVENSLSDSCTYKQKAGDLSDDYIQSISYRFEIGGINAQWIDHPPTTDEPWIIWLTENTGDSIRGGNLIDISIKCICEQTTYKNGKTDTDYSITVSPRQLFHKDIPQDVTITSIVWRDLIFYTNEKYDTKDTTITIGGENTKNVLGVSEDGGNVPLYFRIFGTVYYSDGTEQDTYYGQLASIPAPSTNIIHVITTPNDSVIVSSSQITTSGENCYVNIVVGSTTNTQVAEVAKIQFTLNSYNSNGIKWSAVKWNKDLKDVSIWQNAYKGTETVKITYSASIDYIEISRNSNSEYSKFTSPNPVTFSISGNEAITEIYYKIYIKVVKNENGNPVSSEYISYSEASSNLTITPSNRFGEASSPASATYKSSVTGAESTVEECDFSMTVEVSSGTKTYNGETLSYSSKKFENCCRIVKTKEIVIVEDWSNITFYSNSACTNEVTSITIDSDSSSYDFWFKITGISGSTPKTFNGDASLISLKEHSEITNNDLSFTPSKWSTDYIYSANRNISDVDEDKLVSTIYCASCEGDTNITGTLKIYKKATVVPECYMYFYNPSTSSSIYDSWVDTNIFGSYSYGDVATTSLTTSSANVPNGTKIYIRSSEKPIVKLGNENISVVNQRSDLYYFIISANNSTTSLLTYKISISCKTEQYSLNVCAKGTITTYKIEWISAIWDYSLNDSSTSGSGTQTSGCYNDTEFTWNFRIKGVRKTYENDEEVSNSDTTVWLSDISQIILTRDTHDTNNVHLISDNITLASGCSSTFTIYGASEGNKLSSNISHSGDTSSRYCSITLKITSGSSGNTSWSENNNLTDGTFTLTQSGNTWDPFITY